MKGKAKAQKGQLSPSWGPRINPASPLLPSIHTHCFCSLLKAVRLALPQTGFVLLNKFPGFSWEENTAGSQLTLIFGLGMELELLFRYIMAWLKPFPH